MEAPVTSAEVISCRPRCFSRGECGTLSYSEGPSGHRVEDGDGQGEPSFTGKKIVKTNAQGGLSLEARAGAVWTAEYPGRRDDMAGCAPAY